jgi:succinate dehydrogenase / fumarate reductase flavoprotein subunit
MILDGKIPSGPLHEKWDKRLAEIKLVSPANKRKYRVIVVGTGLAGASAAASLGELGYNVDAFCFQDTPRRGHSIAAQGGINAAKNYPNDGDSIERLFIDTLKGGDFRSREANVYRLAQVSNNIIDQAVAQGVHSPVTMPVISTTVRSAGRWYRVHSSRAARPASSSCSAPTAR